MPFLVGQRRGGHCENRDEHDQGEEIPLHRGTHRVGRDELHDEPGAGGDLLRRLPHGSGVGSGRLTERRLLVGSDGRERQQQRRHDEADQDRRERGAPEERERPDAEPAHAAQVAEPRDAGEQGGGDERDHDHRQQVQEQRAERLQPPYHRDEQRRVRQDGGETEPEPGREPERHRDMASDRSHGIISGTMITGAITLRNR